MIGEVIPPTGLQTLKASNYRLGHSPWAEKFWSKDIKPDFNKPVTVRVKTIDGATEDITLSSTAAQQHFRWPFVGKGSPEQVQIAIQLVYRFHRATTTLQDFVNGDFVGLDCNGFVGNDIQRVMQGQLWATAPTEADPGPTTLITDLLTSWTDQKYEYDYLTIRVDDTSELDADGTYLFGYCDPNGKIRDPSHDDPTHWGHVMITEPGTLKQAQGGFTIGVVEATAAGLRKLRNLDYKIRAQVTKTSYGPLFQVERGTDKDVMNVQIALLNVR